MNSTRSAKQIERSTAPPISRREVGRGDHVAFDLLEQVDAEGVDERLADQWQQRLGGLHEAVGEVGFGVAGVRQVADDQFAVGLGDP